MKTLRKFGITRWAAYNGLDTLEKAHLIEVVRRPGLLPIVTVLDCETDITLPHHDGDGSLADNQILN